MTRVKVVFVGYEFSMSAGHGLISPAIMQRDEDRRAIFTSDEEDDESSSTTSFTTMAHMVSRPETLSRMINLIGKHIRTHKPGRMAPSIPFVVALCCHKANPGPACSWLMYVF